MALDTLREPLSEVQSSTVPRLPKWQNKATGKESNHKAAFCDTRNEERWGLATQSFAKSACGLSDQKFDKIQKLAMKHVRPTTCSYGYSSDTFTNDDTAWVNYNDKWAHLTVLDDSKAE